MSEAPSPATPLPAAGEGQPIATAAPDVAPAAAAAAAVDASVPDGEVTPAVAPPKVVEPAPEAAQAAGPAPLPGAQRAKPVDTEAQRTFDAMKDERERQPPPLEAGRTLRDVTEPLRLGSPFLDAAPQDVSQWVTHLRRERVLVLASASPDVLEAALHGIADSDALRTHTRKAKLVLGKTPSTPDSFQLCCLPDGDESGSDGAEVLLIVEATHSSARDFLEDLFRDPVTQRAARMAELTRLSRHVLVLMTADLLSERDHSFGHGGSALPCLLLPFHRQLIGHAFASEDNATRAQLIAAFETQRDAGSWGTTEQDQYKKFHSQWKGRTLRAELDAGAFGPPQEPVTIGADVLVNTLLFVACFLNELSPSDFQIVLLRLLASEQDPTWQPGVAGEAPRLLKQRWLAQSQALLANVGLTIGPSVQFKGKQQLLFGDGNLEARKVAFRSQQFFLLENCRRKLEEGRVLFDASVPIAESFSSFLAERAADDQSLDDAWLFELLAPALADDLAPALASARLEACNRVLGELLAKGCAATVKGYFERLCQSGRHDVVLLLGRRLTNAKDFDELGWLKRCLDQGTAEVSERAYARLLSLALRPGSRALERSRSWLTTSASAPSRSHLMLLRLCVELSELPIWAPSLPALTARRAPCLIEPAALLVVLELSCSQHVEAALDEHGRWLFELKKLVDVWFVPDSTARLLGDGADALRFHLLATWLALRSHDKSMPPHLGVLQAIALAGAALCMPRDERVQLAREARGTLATLPRQQQSAVELRLRAIEQCLTEVTLWLDRSRAATSHEPGVRERWRAAREALAQQRGAISDFRGAMTATAPQPRNREHAQPD